MKRTPLVRKTPLKRSPLVRKTPLKATSGVKPKSPLKSSLKIKGPSKSRKKAYRGAMGHGRSASDVLWHASVAASGCFACRQLGLQTRLVVRIHHPNGRNKGKGDHCEKIVIALCDDHHDPSINSNADRTQPSVHGNKRLFKDLIGTEMWCVMETYRLLETSPPWLLEHQWSNYLDLVSLDEQESMIVVLGSVGRSK
jgi:hypothetical protein